MAQGGRDLFLLMAFRKFVSRPEMWWKIRGTEIHMPFLTFRDCPSTFYQPSPGTSLSSQNELGEVFSKFRAMFQIRNQIQYMAVARNVCVCVCVGGGGGGGGGGVGASQRRAGDASL